MILVALLVSRSCGATDPEISTDEAIEIARGAVDFEPDCERVRFVKRGLQQGEYWLVGLARNLEGGGSQYANVLVDADTGEIFSVQTRADASFEC